MSVLRCTEAFAVQEGNVPRVIRMDDVVDSKDPVVKGHEHLFEPVEDHLNRQRRIRDGEAIETATAGPGEVRKSQRRPSRRTTARKAAAKRRTPAAKEAAAKKAEPPKGDDNTNDN